MSVLLSSIQQLEYKISHFWLNHWLLLHIIFGRDNIMMRLSSLFA